MWYDVTVWNTLMGHHAPLAMDDLTFSAPVATDLEDAHDHSTDACNAIEALQVTDLWFSLPVETRRTLCAAHAHLAALSDTLSQVV